MPILPVDTRPFTFQIDDFVGGLNSYFPANKVGDNFLTTAQNALVGTDGVLTRRPGITVLGGLGTGTDDPEPLTIGVFGEGDKRKIYAVVQRNSTPPVVVVYTWPVSGGWGAVTLTYTIVTEDVSDVADMTFVRAGPSDNPGVEYVYLSLSEGKTGRLTITDSSTIPTGTEQDPAVNNQAPRDARIIKNCPSPFMSRVFLAGFSDDNRDRVFYSRNARSGNDLWDQNLQNFPIPSNSGEAITTIHPWRDNTIFVGTEGACFLITQGTSEVGVDWIPATISTSIGVAAHHTVKNVGEDLYFMDQCGNIRSLARTLQEGGSGVRNVPISEPIKNEIDDINFSLIHRSNAGFFGDNYWISFNTSTNGWRLFVFNIALQRWFGPMVLKDDSGNVLRVMGMATSFNDLASDSVGSRGAHFYFLTDDDQGSTLDIQVYELDSSATQDHGATDIDLSVTTKAHDFGSPGLDKELDWVEITYKKNAATTGYFTIEARVDFDEEWTEVGNIDYSEGKDIQWQKIPLLSLRNGRTFQFRITCSDSNAHPEIVRMVVHGRPIAMEDSG